MLLLPEPLPENHNKPLKRPSIPGGLHMPILGPRLPPKAFITHAHRWGLPHQAEHACPSKGALAHFLLTQPHIWSSAPGEPVPVSFSILEASKLAQITEGAENGKNELGAPMPKKILFN